MYDDEQLARMLMERMPSPKAISLLLQHRAHGVDWDEIEDRVMGIVPELAITDMPMADEAERYSRRLLIAATALEYHGLNN